MNLLMVVRCSPNCSFGYMTLHRFVSDLRLWLTEKRVKKRRSLPVAIEKMTMHSYWTCFHGARYIVTIRQHPDVLHATSRTFNGFERHKIQTFSGGLLYLNFVSNRLTEKKMFNSSHERRIFCGLYYCGWYCSVFLFKWTTFKIYDDLNLVHQVTNRCGICKN